MITLYFFIIINFFIMYFVLTHNNFTFSSVLSCLNLIFIGIFGSKIVSLSETTEFYLNTIFYTNVIFLFGWTYLNFGYERSRNLMFLLYFTLIFLFLNGLVINQIPPNPENPQISIAVTSIFSTQLPIIISTIIAIMLGFACTIFIMFHYKEMNIFVKFPLSLMVGNTAVTFVLLVVSTHDQLEFNHVLNGLPLMCLFSMMQCVVFHKFLDPQQHMLK